MALSIRDAARNSIGSRMPAKSLELQHTIRLIRELDAEIHEIEAEIETMMDEIQSPITTIPGIGYRMGAMILAEAGDLSRFASPDKLLAYAGMSPSTYQSGQLKNCYPHMEKRGSRYLRYALLMPPNMSAFGIQPLPPISPRNGQRASTTMWPSPMLPRSWFGLSSPWRSPGNHTAQQLKPTI